MYEAPKKSKINFSSIEKIADTGITGGGTTGGNNSDNPFQPSTSINE